MTKRRPKTAAELVAELAEDPARNFQAAHEERTRRAREEELQRGEASMVDALRKVGITVKSVWDLVNSGAEYPKAIPVLVSHLMKTEYDPLTREGIARALTTTAAKKLAWDALVSAFQKEREKSSTSVKWPLANALAFHFDRSKVDMVADLVRDKRHGENRVALIEALARVRDPRVPLLLSELVDDPEVSSYAEQALRRNRRLKR
jgi:hypothetical protein